MLTRFKRACLLLLALPAAALADPINVTSHSTGITSMVSQDLKELPYELTITSTFDSATLFQFETETPTGVLYRMRSQSNVPFEIELRIGDETYHYSGLGSGELFHEVPNTPEVLERFSHEITIYYGREGASRRIGQTGMGPAGIFGEGGLLATRNVDEDMGLTSSFVSSSGSGMYIDYTFGTGGPSTFSMQVSPVPEPASFALLMGGLLVLGLRQRARQGGVTRT